jgi:ribA/ribD-fused uncharacterized protein
MKTYDKYTFFWSGPFSQWYHSPFYLEGQMFGCAEQYMMYMKAKVFGDNETARKIMETDSPREQKALGRKVKTFNVDTWAVVAKDIVFRGNMAKFTQNIELFDELAGTIGTLIVEASPFDAVWGIGLDEKTAAVTPRGEWKGTNWLGQICTEVRDSFENLISGR